MRWLPLPMKLFFRAARANMNEATRGVSEGCGNGQSLADASGWCYGHLKGAVPR